MKFGDQPAMFSQYEGISPEVFRAQRMAELEQVAKYKSEKLQKYKDWTDPGKRAALIAEVEMGSADERRKVAAMAAIFAREFDERDRRQIGTMTNIYKPGKPKWYERVLEWFGLL